MVRKKKPSMRPRATVLPEAEDHCRCLYARLVGFSVALTTEPAHVLVRIT